MKKKKILFLVHTLQMGGAEKVLVDLVNNLPIDKYEVTVMTILDIGVLKSCLGEQIQYKSIYPLKWLKKLSGSDKKYDVATSGSGSKKDSRLKKLFIKMYEFYWRHANQEKIYKKHIKEEYDTEIAFLEGIPAKVISGSNNKNSKKICWIHIDLINEPKSDRFFRKNSEQRAVYNNFDEIICVSKVVKEHFIEKIQISEQKVHIIYNPVNPEDIREKANKDTISRDKNKVVFCSVGRLNKQKGYDRLLEASNRLEKEGYGFETWIIGAGPEEYSLSKYLEQQKMKSVKLLGYKRNPYCYVNAADWVICSSRAEGFSTAMTEAAILGKAIISTDCSGTKEILGENSRYGICCNNSLDGIYDSMKKVLENNNLKTLYEKRIKSKIMPTLENAIRCVEKVL